MSIPTASLGEVADFINGAAFKPEDWGDEGLPIIRIQNLTDHSKPLNRTLRKVDDRYHVRNGELLVSWSASLGVFEWQRGDALLNQHIFRVIPNAKVIDKSYLFYALTGALQDMERHLHGATMRHVNREEFLGTKICLPLLGEQRRIAAILDQADALRRKRKQSLSLTNTLSDSLITNLLREKSKAWKLSALSDLIVPNDRINYGVVQPGDDVEGGASLVRVANVVDNDFSDSVLKHILPSIEKQYVRSRLRGSEILIACVGSIGAISIATQQMQGFNIARAVARIPSDPTRINRAYLAAFLRSAECQRYFRSEIRVVAQPTLNIKQICETRVPIPPRNLQEKLEAQMMQINATVMAQTGHLQHLDELFNVLQKDMFNSACLGTPSRPATKLAAE